MQTSTPVLILPCGLGHGSTCLVRSLGRIGVPVYCVESDPGAFASRSRYCKGRFAWDDQLPVPESVEFLIDVSRKIGQRPILIPTTDDTVTLVADHAATLKEWFIFPELSSPLVRGFCSKKEMYCLAKRVGIPTPDAVFPTSRGDVLSFAENAAFPVMVKGIDGNHLAKRVGKKMFIVHSASELLQKYDAVEDPNDPNLMLQEYIPGDDEAVCGVEAYFNGASECVFSVSGNKIRQWPAYKGITTLGVCVKNDAIAQTTRKFMKATGYKGILDIGYRYDSRDGLYKVLDVNPRIGCTFRLFVAEDGMDVARALYLDLTGQPVSQAPFQEGRKWIVEDLDLLASLRYVRDGKMTFKHCLGSFRGVRETAYFAVDDPRPFFAMCMSRGKELGRRMFRNMRRGAARHFKPAYSANRWA